MLKILIAGDGGQGVQTMADIICRAVFENNKHVTFIPNYGLEQRGGVSLAFIQISDTGISYPKFTHPDILVTMSDQARERTRQYAEGGDNFKILDAEGYKDEIEQNKIGASSLNIFLLGMLAKILEYHGMVNRSELFLLLKEKLEKKSGWPENEKAFNAGVEIFKL